MSVQVLVASVNQVDHSLIEKMNISSDVIVGNQCDQNYIEKFEYKGFSACYLNFAERGVGLNRNNTLMRASGEFCLFADDDMVYVDNYSQIVEEAFKKHHDADMLIFNLIEPQIRRYVIKNEERVGYFNFLRYGMARVAVRLKSVRDNGIFFNQCYGGGTEHCHGEDNIFIADCLKAGFKIYAIPVAIARLTEERVSTWNKGYSDKYFKDQGSLYHLISRKWWKLLCLQDAIRHRHEYKDSILKLYKKMIDLNEKKNSKKGESSDMVSYTFKRKMFVIGEMAFCTYSDYKKCKCDIVNMHSSDIENYALKSDLSLKQYTFENYLGDNEDEIQKKFNKNYRYEIRRANKEGIDYQDFTDVDESTLTDFENIYNSMFREKNLDNKFNRNMIISGIESGKVVITAAKSIGKDRCRVYHAYFYDSVKTVLIYSASSLWGEEEKSKVALIGRMNKALHWHDMCYFKKAGCDYYEWGGIENPEKLNGIAKFKAGFGGELKYYYNYTIPINLKGKIYIYAMKLKGKK